MKKVEKVSDADLKKRVFRENNEIYYYEDEHIDDLYLLKDTMRKNKLVRKNIKNYKPNY